MSKLIFFLFIFLVACGTLSDDIHPNPASSGYNRMEFDISYNGFPTKEIGIGNINLDEDQDLGDISFKFYGIYNGTLYMKSPSCGINLSVPFQGETVFHLKDLIPHPMKCSIDLIAETSPIDKKQHNIVETGKIKINVIPHQSGPVTFEYVRTTRKYSWDGQGSIQRQEGALTSEENFTVKTSLTKGGLFRVAGCNNSQTIEGSFLKGNIVIKLKDIYKKDYLTIDDTCDLEVIVIPNEIPESLVGRFSVSIFDKNAVILENLNYVINKNKLEVSGQAYILACSINGVVALKNKCSAKYRSNTIYWVRGLTSNGRKSIFALKSGAVFWTE